MIVRRATPADAPVIAALLGELGYPASPAEVVGRLERLAAFSSATALVADIEGQVVGVVTGHLFPSIHATPLVAWLTTLVVSSAAQSRGVGRQLVAAVEDWARQAGAVRISVTSASHRDAAHSFYEKIGYAHTGVRLTKSLT